MNKNEREILKQIVCEIDDVHSTLEVLHVYCKACSEAEEIYNITFLVDTLLQKTDKLMHNLSKLGETETTNDYFLSKITPIDKNIIDINED